MNSKIRQLNTKTNSAQKRISRFLLIFVASSLKYSPSYIFCQNWEKNYDDR
ncbi:MAG: hypothetical protein K0S33_2314 [Bacteroidetes bacterium]|jgi:hypothetical protein|nr:hypothetical protein [Bacteroidota bacterium]